MIDRDVPARPRASMVRNDHKAGMRAAVEHLLDLGHRRIALITGALDLWPVRERIAGMAEARRRARASRDETISLVGSLSAEHGEASHGAAPRDGPAADRDRRGREPGPRRLRARAGPARCPGPDDISLVTCDEVDLSELHHPPIASVARDTLLLGRTAAELLLERLGGGRAADRPAADHLHAPAELRPGPHRPADRSGAAASRRRSAPARGRASVTIAEPLPAWDSRAGRRVASRGARPCAAPQRSRQLARRHPGDRAPSAGRRADPVRLRRRGVVGGARSRAGGPAAAASAWSRSARAARPLAADRRRGVPARAASGWPARRTIEATTADVEFSIIRRRMRILGPIGRAGRPAGPRRHRGRARGPLRRPADRPAA